MFRASSITPGRVRGSVPEASSSSSPPHHVPPLAPFSILNTVTVDLLRQNKVQVGLDIAAAAGIPPWKRTLDITCVLLALPVALPLGIVIGILIKLVSTGPVLFKQERVGFRGERFLCLKFRTMHVNAAAEAHKGYWDRLIGSNLPMVKLDAQGDPRLIPFGLLLRSIGLDELPQLLNVLRGEMSLVGPRPCIPYEYERYLPCHRARCDTLPGLTGLWQVSGKNKLTFDQMIDLDLQYVAKRSLLLDLKIIVRTMPAMIAQAWEVKTREDKASKTTPAQTPSDSISPCTPQISIYRNTQSQWTPSGSGGLDPR